MRKINKTRKIIIAIFVGQVIVSIISAGINILFFQLGYMFDAYNRDTVRLFTQMEVGILIVSFVMNISLWLLKLESKTHLVLAAIFLTLSISTIFTPQITNYFIHYRDEKNQISGHAEFVAEYTKKTEEVVEMIKLAEQNNNRLTANQTLDLMDFGIDSDYSYEGEDDKTAESLAVLRWAFEEKVIDPNIRLSGKQYQDLDSSTVYSYLVNVRNMFKYPPLYKAEAKNTLAVLRMYVDFGVNVKQKDPQGRTILDYIKFLDKHLKTLEEKKSE